MNITQFEEQVKEIIESKGLYIPFTEDECDGRCNSIVTNPSWFQVEIASNYKQKQMNFTMFGKNRFAFNVTANDFIVLFKRALKIIEAYATDENLIAKTRRKKVK